MNRTSIITGVILIIVAIILGAFGAHALKEKLEPEQLLSFEVGVRYQMYHGIALLAVGIGASQLSFSLKLFTRIILAGVLIFSGSLYILSIQDLIGAKLSFMGAIVPIGGSLMIVAWIIFLVKIIRKSHYTNQKEQL
ncbi:MAG: uncharacterized membrane protein YgdD (TMEM256/DUF423 family) [Crocinitomicaceae bacterium]|jgi:uncharacterized membrane protein YgdD (TMEM256/DUF423 family)